MILQSLKEYYERKAADPQSDIAPLGWEKKAFPFLAVINLQGDFLWFSDTREKQGKKTIAKIYTVPSLGEKKGNGIKANLFWENIEYLFGIPLKENSKPERIEQQHTAFIDKIHTLCKTLNTIPDSLRAVCTFLERLDTKVIQSSELWEDVKSENRAILLAINTNDGVVPVTDMPDVQDAITAYNSQQTNEAEGICLVSGERTVLKKLEAPIHGVFGANTTGANLVAVNNKVSGTSNGGQTPAFASFMKEQGDNSPIGEKASLAYTTALNTLLSKDSRQRLLIGDATTVFWADRSCDFEDDFADFFKEPPTDDPDRLTMHVRSLLQAVDTGAWVSDEEPTRFFVLGLSPNAARISVRFWHTGTVAELAERFARYFHDLEIVHGSNEKDHLSLFRLLVATAQQGKAENIAPNLAGSMMRAILEGLPFPESLFQAVLVRIKAERNVTYARAKIVKGYLNRKLQFTPNHERSLSVSLDKDNANVGYRLGRLFATLEKIQVEAIKGNSAKLPERSATIRDRFYAAASTSPLTVFGNLMRLKNYHLAKLENPGRRTNFEKILCEILDTIQVFPAHLSMDDQGRFAIGYYHQMHFFYPNTENQ